MSLHEWGLFSFKYSFKTLAFTAMLIWTEIWKSNTVSENKSCFLKLLLLARIYEWVSYLSITKTKTMGLIKIEKAVADGYCQ